MSSREFFGEFVFLQILGFLFYKYQMVRFFQNSLIVGGIL